MSNEMQYELTVRYPGWEQDGHKFPPFATQYIFTTSIIPYPDWPEDDERWFNYDESTIIAKRFVDWYKKKIRDEFDGEILMIKPVRYAMATDIERPER